MSEKDNTMVLNYETEIAAKEVAMDTGKYKKMADTSSNHSRNQVLSQVETVSFNYEKYVHQSQDFLFKEAVSKYNAFNYEEALSLFRTAFDEGNVFAAAHVGIMYIYGEGCNRDYKEALEWFERGYRHGCPLATAWYSDCYRFGYGVEKNKDYAEKLYQATEVALREMCNVEDTAALYFLGFNLITGAGDAAEGVKLLETAVYRGDVHSTIQLAECYLNGCGVSTNAHQAVCLLTQIPMTNNSKHYYLLGRCYYYGEGIERDYVKAFQQFEKSANLGFGKAKYYLGNCYKDGQGVEKNLQKAIRWYTDAAENNQNAVAALQLAFLYRYGQGVTQDVTKAIKYEIIAAKGDITKAQITVAKEYIYGNNIEKNYASAQMWLEKAAVKGDAEAQLLLGRFYASDFGYKNYQKAFEWIKESAAQGFAEAEHIIGDCCRDGFCVQKDLVFANHWYEMAARKEYPKAMYEFGFSCINGRGMSKDVERGIRYLSAAAEKNIAEACALLAESYKSGIENYNGQNRYTNLSKARVYAQRLVELTDDAKSQYLFASILQELGNGDEAKKWYLCAVDKDYEEAKLALSRMYILEGVNYSDAVSMLKKIAFNKNGEAQYLLAYCLEHGYGCAKDKKQAKALYSAAQANGYL